MRLRWENSENSVAFPKTLIRSTGTTIGPGEQPEALRAVKPRTLILVRTLYPRRTLILVWLAPRQ